MSMTATLSLPKTVATCHAEIERLRTAAADLAQVKDENRTLRSELDERDAEIEDLGKEIDELEEKLKAIERQREDAASDLIRDFIAECERPVGTLNYSLPNTPAGSRAILQLVNFVQTQEGKLL